MVKIGTSERPDLPLAVIVGAGGVAIAIARRLGQHYRLLLADMRGDHAAQCAAALRVDGYDAVSAVCDVTDAAAVEALTNKAAAQGPLRVLCHVVGLSPSMADAYTIMRVNLPGAARVAEAMLRIATQGTAAVFISSIAAYSPMPEVDITQALDDPLQSDLVAKIEKALGAPLTTARAYIVSKHGVNRMCQRLAPAWGKKGARIMSVSPGLIASPMGALEFQRQPLKYDLLAKTPIQREGTLLEVADAVAFLTSDKASFISGIDLRVDGGLIAAQQYGG
jgi:NAD(P)-dependent dehydrogenase (short-subunit alcohol dehydrogenase family)